MPIRRTFLDWTRPALPAVVEYLRQHYARRDTWDLDQVVLVFPGARAGRRVLELLVEQAAGHQLQLRPPSVCTVGVLPELLYESKRPFANDLVQRLAWIKALQELGPEACRPHIHQLPDANDHDQWLELAALLERLHRELAADALDFGRVAERGRELGGPAEADRWQYLHRVQERYLAILDELELWDRQTARLFAIAQHECRTDREIVLVATSDMNLAMRRMLDQVGDRVTAIVHAPAEWAERFDAHGCVIPDAWQDVPIPLTAPQLRLVEGPAEQADAVLDVLASYAGRYRADEVVIGVPDEQLVPLLLRRLAHVGLAARWVVDKTLRETAPYRLLEALAGVLRRGRFADFAALLRHPDVSDWLAAQGFADPWLVELDAYYRRHLPTRFGHWEGDVQEHARLREVAARLQAVVQPLDAPAAALSDWAGPIVQLLRTFYGQRELLRDDPDERRTVKALSELRAALELWQRLPPPVAPVLTASQAFEQLLRDVADAQLPAAQTPDQIELLGWLELPLDTAPALIITSFNDGCVPTSVNADLFLPDALRRQLELLDNRRRYARDAYALSVLCAAREDLTLVVARQSAEHDPLLPSRLLFATDRQTMAERARAFFGRETTAVPPRSVRHTAAVPPQRAALAVPRPARLAQPLTTLSVTAFRSYLACPYRFYLRHALGLVPADDDAEELGPDMFGTLLHEVLREFGTSAARTETDAGPIRRFLHDALNRYVTRQFGADHLPALAVQVVQARMRLDAFAQWQAQRTSEGWLIEYVETSGGASPACLPIDARTNVTLKGRIDRIDCRDGQRAIFDYKTGDAAKSPRETHLKAGKWIDLQLPLYVLLAKTLGITEPVELGYILLPKDVAKVGASMAEWTEPELAEAIAVATDVARRIYHQQFWPPTYPPPEMLTEFSAICQDQTFHPLLSGEAGPEAEA
jgi:RecB family exonuclease